MPLFQSISPQEKIDFTRSLSLLIKSGIPINQAFDILSSEAKSGVLKKTLLIAKEKIERGSSISEVFAENPNFEPVFAGFIKAGEESGTLDVNLKFLSDWLEKKYTLEKEISRVTLYPRIIIAFALILGTGLALFVLPKLVPIFKALNIKMPITTRILLFISAFMEKQGLQFVIGFFFFIILFYFLSKLKPVRKITDKLILQIPVIGSLSKDYQLTMISQLTSVLVESGLPINKILEIVSQSLTNFEYKKAINEIRERVTRGTKISETVKNYPRLFPSIFSFIVASGEQTGTFDASFNQLADFFSTRMKEKAERLPVVIEPTLLILIGLFVAFIASAIIMPIYEITKGLY